MECSEMNIESTGHCREKVEIVQNCLNPSSKSNSDVEELFNEQNMAHLDNRSTVCEVSDDEEFNNIEDEISNIRYN
jgi:hypothetical protein